jgi:hypothetical protein
MKFKYGDKVRVKHDKTHSGIVIHQTDYRVLWKCQKCNSVSDDYTNELEKVKK